MLDRFSSHNGQAIERNDPRRGTSIWALTAEQRRPRWNDAAGTALVKAGWSVRYRSIFDAVRDFLHDEAFDSHERVIAPYLKRDLLILNDMGVKRLPKRSGEYLFEVIMLRHELRSTMMTSNRAPEDSSPPATRRSSCIEP